MHVCMERRKEKILRRIFDEYIKTHEPVGSRLLSRGADISASPATIRNEMAELEEMGYLTHPHTSAGRIPTEKGFQYLAEHLLEPRSLVKKDREIFLRANRSSSDRRMKNLAHALAEVSSCGVFVAFTKESFFYTGLSHLFSLPEFTDHAYTFSMSEVIDHLDETLERHFDRVGEGIDIYIGKNNPFGADCSALVTAFYARRDEKSLLGILGPLRMDYERNYSSMEFVRKLIEI